MIVSALAALQIALDEAYAIEKEILGILESDRIAAPNSLRLWFAAVKTHSDEWSIFAIRLTSTEEELEWNERLVPGEPDMVVANITNALSHAEALLDCMGHATNIL